MLISDLFGPTCCLNIASRRAGKQERSWRRRLVLHRGIQAIDPVSISSGLEHFEPQLSPAIAVAAAVAALPPILFWFRVFLNANKRLKDKAQAEVDRQVHCTSLSFCTFSNRFGHVNGQYISARGSCCQSPDITCHGELLNSLDPHVV